MPKESTNSRKTGRKTRCQAEGLVPENLMPCRAAAVWPDWLLNASGRISHELTVRVAGYLGQGNGSICMAKAVDPQERRRAVAAGRRFA